MKEVEAWCPLQLLSTYFIFLIYLFIFRSLTEPAVTDPARLAANELWGLPESESSTQARTVTLGFGMDVGDLNLGLHACKCFTH